MQRFGVRKRTAVQGLDCSWPDCSSAWNTQLRAGSRCACLMLRQRLSPAHHEQAENRACGIRLLPQNHSPGLPLQWGWHNLFHSIFQRTDRTVTPILPTGKAKRQTSELSQLAELGLAARLSGHTGSAVPCCLTYLVCSATGKLSSKMLLKHPGHRSCMILLCS